jgi:hypothetical protein
MATDRDRFARVLDKRFNKIAFLFGVDDAACVGRTSEYILVRELEAEPGLKGLFLEAHRVLTRADVPLIPGADPGAARIHEEGLRSFPASRLSRAFDDARKYGHELAEALAARSVRWVAGCLETQPDWQDTRQKFAARRGDIIADLTVRIRAQFLGIGDRPIRTSPKAANQADILSESLRVNP